MKGKKSSAEKIKIFHPLVSASIVSGIPASGYSSNLPWWFAECDMLKDVRATSYKWYLTVVEQKHKNVGKKILQIPSPSSQGQDKYVLFFFGLNMYYLKAKKCRNEKWTKPNLLGALRIRNKRVERWSFYQENCIKVLLKQPTIRINKSARFQMEMPVHYPWTIWGCTFHLSFIFHQLFDKCGFL